MHLIIYQKDFGGGLAPRVFPFNKHISWPACVGMVCCLSPKRHYWLVLDQYHPEYEHDVFPSTWKKEQSPRVDQNSIREKESVITGPIMGLYTHRSASLSSYLLGLDVESSNHQAHCSIKTITAQTHRGAEADKSCFFFSFPLLEHRWWALSVEGREETCSSEMCLYLMGDLGSTCSYAVIFLTQNEQSALGRKMQMK